jgi:hypothetical protein
MKQKISRNQNRVWVVVNYLTLLLLVALFYIGKHFHWPIIVLLCEIGVFAILLLSFHRVFLKTKLWKMVHSSDTELDEREMQVVLKSLKHSYSIFTIICLVIIYGFAVAEGGPIDVLIAGALLYMAHTLPAAIVGWNEKIIITGSE